MEAPSSPPHLDCRKLLIILLVVVCTIFIILCCHWLKKHCTSGNYFRRQNQTVLPLSYNTNNFDQLAVELQTEGLASSVIFSLPAVQFRNEIKGAAECHGQCAVCFVEFHSGDWLRLLPNCAHVFHVQCIDAWFRQNSSCPLCRTSVLHHLEELISSTRMVSKLETLLREERSQDKSLGFRLLELEIKCNPAFRMGATSVQLFEGDSDDSSVLT